MQVRYQAAPRSDEPGILPEVGAMTTASVQYFQDFGEFLAQYKCARHIRQCDGRRACFLGLFESLTRATEREAFFVKQLANAPY